MEIMAEFEDESIDMAGPDLVLPWWRNPLTQTILIAALLVGLLAFGYRWGHSNGGEEFNKVDVGYLQDMRVHHEQAVNMSILYLEGAPDGTRLIREIAREILVDQSIDNGRMIQMLRIFHKPEANPTDTGMSWMDMPSPLEQMPGMASDDELVELSKATGSSADKLFVELMIDHHEGGIHMSEYVVKHGLNDEVVAMAQASIKAQQSDLAELKKFAKANS